jgi:hypothetical protein
MLSDYRGGNTITIATETGKVDGALFSPDERFLMHHSCEPVGPRLGLRCSLRLTDLQSPTPEAMLLGTMPMQRYGDTRNGLLAQFTRDSKYIMLLERYNGEREVHLYDIAAGSSIRLPWATGEGGFADIDQSPLIPGLSRGLAQWSGENVLANTDRTVDLSRAQGGQDPAIGYQLVRGHWAEVSPGGQYLVYLGGQDVSPGAGDYRVYSVPLAPSGRILGQFEPPIMLLRTTVRPSEWRQSNYLLPDGHTLMTIAAPNPGAARGLYAYDLDTAESRLITAGATELWSPGYSQPLQDDLLR